VLGNLPLINSPIARIVKIVNVNLNYINAVGLRDVESKRIRHGLETKNQTLIPGAQRTLAIAVNGNRRTMYGFGEVTGQE
jgi:hypothetical protein